MRCHVIPRIPKGVEDGVDLLPFFLVRDKSDDDSTAIVGVALPLHEPGLLQPVEHPGDRPGGQPREIGELTSSHWAGKRENVNDLHIRDGHPDPGRRRSEEGRTKPVELPQLLRKFSE